MVNHPPYTVVLTYTDEPRQLTMQAVDSVLVAPLIEGKMAVPFSSMMRNSGLTMNWHGNWELQCLM